MLEGERNDSGFHSVSRDQHPVTSIAAPQSMRHGITPRRFEAQLRQLLASSGESGLHRHFFQDACFLGLPYPKLYPGECRWNAPGLDGLGEKLRMEFDRILLAQETKRIDTYVVDKAGVHRADSQRGLLEVHDPFFVLRLDCKSKHMSDWIYEVMQLVYRPQVECCKDLIVHHRAICNRRFQSCNAPSSFVSALVTSESARY